jgi:Ca2+-binding EF-hand superfamily protein
MRILTLIAYYSNNLQIAFLDSAGNSVTGTNAMVTAALSDNPGMMQVWDRDKSDLDGTRIVQSRGGKAIFTDLVLTKASLGQGYENEAYTIVFMVQVRGGGSLRTQTAALFVQPSKWAGLLILPSSQPGTFTLTAGRPFDVHVRVMLVDDFKNKLLPKSAPAGTMVDVLLVSSSNASTQLQRHSCNEVCVGLKPTVCTTCSDMQLDAQNGEVTFTDLRTDISGKGYRLQFSSSFFQVTSQAFNVVNSAPSYLQMEQQPSKTNRADLELKVQPVVSMRDKYGNLVLQDSVTAHTIEVQISTLGGSLSASGLLDDPGQKSNPPIAGTRVMNTTNAVAAFTDLAVRPSMASLQLHFLGTSSSGLLTVISDRFGVEPGEAVGLGILKLPDRCSALSPCIDAATIACVDAFGNVQPTCGTCLGSVCNIRPYGNLPNGMNIPCFGKVCVSIIQPEDAVLRMGSGGTDGLNCAEQACGEEIDTVSGLATFTQLVLTVPSPMYILKFTTYLVNERSRMVYEWTYISPLVNNLPPQPVLTKAQFSASLSSILIQFDRSTNMNLIPDQDNTVSCDAVLDHTFVVTLGLGPSCTWTSPSSYLILPGTGASAGPTTNVVLSNASYIVYSGFFSGVEMTSLPASTTAGAIVLGVPLKALMLSLPDTLPRPVPILLGAEQLSSCDLLSLDAGLSQGSASRPFKGVRWSIDYHRTFIYQGLLTSEGSTLEFIKRAVHFSTRMPNLISTVTITLRPSAPVEGNSTLSISGIPQYHMSYSGCPARPFHLGRPCLEARQECMAVHLAGPSAFKFASHLHEDPLEGQRVQVSWWQVASVGNFFANIDVDRSKYLSQLEFTQALMEAGDFVSNDRSRKRFEAIDSDDDNLLSEKEFATTRPITGVPFASLDLDGSLTVNMTELNFYFSGAGAQDYISKAQVLARFESLDVDQNGRVSSSEFGAAPALAMHSRNLQFHPAAFLGLNGGLQLQVHPSHYLAAGEDTVIQFQMQNPSLPYPAHPIIISSRCVACTCSDRLCQQKTTKIFAATQMKMNCPDQLCQEDAVFKLDENKLSISGSISESTRNFGTHNILTLSFTTSHLLPSGSILLLKGLPLLSRLPQGAAGERNDEQMDLCLTGRSSLPLDCQSCEGAAPAESGGAFGSWLPRAGEIRMQVRNGFSLPAGQHELSFRFYNPTTTLRTPCQSGPDGVKLAGQDCPSLATLTLQASYVHETLYLATAAILRTGGTARISLMLSIPNQSYASCIVSLRMSRHIQLNIKTASSKHIACLNTCILSTCNVHIACLK